MADTHSTALVWLRRDLRDHDHAAFAAALRQARTVYAAFVFDRDILAPLLDADANPHASARDRRVEFIRESLVDLDAALRRRGGGLIVRHASARDEIPRLAAALGAEVVYATRDYEPAAVERDDAVGRALKAAGRRLGILRDQVVFDRDDLMTGAGRFYAVFTPYARAWRRNLTPERIAVRECGGGMDCAAAEAPAPVGAGRLAAPPTLPAPAGSADPRPLDAPLPALADLGFAPADLAGAGLLPGMTGAARALDAFLMRIGRYGRTRDFPHLDTTSRLSVHLRFGTVSARALVRAALAHGANVAADAASDDGPGGADVWLNELIWREFYFQLLHHAPQIAAGAAFKPEYDRIDWVGGAEGEARFAAWRDGRTGYPIVDAAMAQFNATGFMHNRLRMVTASFLVKDLGIDWRRGEAWFAARLNDFDLAANNGGWQWCASSGCDAQPWFRIFNPSSQSLKFDPESRFIRHWLPALGRVAPEALHDPAKLALAAGRGGVRLGRDYPAPIVEHDAARKATLARYAVVKKS
ncbi:cryptochrome/photolyase family protein [Derxia lacustris]|uniref:cryptochrome/photolyase family protein n=1 Tax=Derxia lacustris TaxID=764842 RepID=UPI00111C5772|nr:deoxyribodipyrimidine photo-lyase [Derxia lacustris]